MYIHSQPALVVALALLLGACASNRVDTTNPLAAESQKSGGLESMSLTSHDFQYAVETAVDEFLAEPLSNNPSGGRWVVEISDVINDTTVMFDTSAVTSQMKSKLRRSGRFIFTAATGQDRAATLVDQRELQNSSLFDQSTVAVGGTVVAPELSIVGAVRSRNVYSPDRRKQSQAYAFDFSVIDINSGLILFETYVTIDKVGANKNFAW